MSDEMGISLAVGHPTKMGPRPSLVGCRTDKEIGISREKSSDEMEISLVARHGLKMSAERDVLFRYFSRLMSHVHVNCHYFHLCIDWDHIDGLVVGWLERILCIIKL